METAAGVWDDFGQKVDLTARLREILLNYPEGTSILKELVQNAVRSLLLPPRGAVPPANSAPRPPLSPRRTMPAPRRIHTRIFNIKIFSVR